ncbi:MAG: hypothetical protein ACM31C_08250 [Acidobacteriota bacterium]
MRLALVLVLIAATAHGQPRRRNALSWSEPAPKPPTNANHVELGGGASAGWHPLLDVHIRCDVTDRWSVAARERLDDAGVRAGELELAYVLATRTTRIDYLRVRGDLLGDAGGGAADFGSVRGLAFAGARVRAQMLGIPDFAFELGARASWVPLAASARGLATEVMASVSMSCPIDRRTCWPF